MKNYILFILSLFFFSCRAYYVPNENSTPMLSQKNNLFLNASIGGGLRATNYTGSVAYSPINNIGMVYQSSIYSNGENNNNINKGVFNELSLGYYQLINNKLLIELYYNRGFGSSKNYYTDFQTKIEGSYETAFNKNSMNFAIGKVGEQFGISFFTRVGRLDLYDVRFRNIFNSIVEEELNNIKNKRYFTFIEPGLTANFDVKYFNIYLKGSMSMLDEYYTKLHFQQFQITYGLQLELNKLFKK